MVTIAYVSLPNIIAGEYLVPELIQNDANPDNIAQQAIAILQSDTTALIQAFNNIHQQLNLNASEEISTHYYGFYS
ncbi:Lipid-A-disaccharide synthase (EC [uncultured Gammaproteobacteria bacterium]|nr:Lipid-A-disaccharide synthase (EC [uncultured Gammaproteobacteria bacterium]